MQNFTLSNPISFLILFFFIVALSYLATVLESRHEQVIDFNRLNYMAFHIAVRLNPEYDKSTAIVLFQLFNDHYPNYFDLYFSNKPLTREAWFNPNQLQLFFNYKTVKN